MHWCTAERRTRKEIRENQEKDWRTLAVSNKNRGGGRQVQTYMLPPVNRILGSFKVDGVSIKRRELG